MNTIRLPQRNVYPIKSSIVVRIIRHHGGKKILDWTKSFHPTKHGGKREAIEIAVERRNEMVQKFPPHRTIAGISRLSKPRDNKVFRSRSLHHDNAHVAQGIQFYLEGAKKRGVSMKQARANLSKVLLSLVKK